MNTVILPETADAEMTTAEDTDVNPLSLTVTAAVAAITIMIVTATETVTAAAKGRLTEPLEPTEQHGRPKDAATHSQQETPAAGTAAVKMTATAIAAANADSDRSTKAR